MNYLNITPCSLCDGLGVRVVLWVSGCSHHCEGCHNRCSWDYQGGHPFTEETFHTLVGLLEKPYIKGLTLSGGDPLSEKNIDKVTEIAQRVKKIFPNKDIWCYTGYLWEEVKDLEITKYIDVLVDGEFKKDKRDVSLAFRGSSNQRVIDIATGGNLF